VSYQVYKLIHLVALFYLFAALGGHLLHGMNGGTKATNGMRGLLAATHGIALLLLLVSGFGMLAKMGMTSAVPMWASAKIGVWVLFGASLALAGRAQGTAAKVLWLVLPLVGLSAASLAVYKPF
jgi:hypothetical protein